MSNSSSRPSRPRLAVLAASALLLATTATIRAVPSFARQMNTQCIQCHTDFPVLSDFGRQFKLSGYTLATVGGDMPPIAVMIQPSFTHTAASQDGGAAPGFHDNNNFALNQASIFYAGRLFGPFAERAFSPSVAAFANKFGIFSQSTYDGIGKTWSWDNTELRYADSAEVAGKAVTYGFYANNNPTMQDPWNSTPAWSFPFTGSPLAPTPAAATLIDGGLAQQVLGVGAYAMINNSVYLDFGSYHTVGAHFQKEVGVDPTDETQVGGLAPYWRAAYVHPLGEGTLEVGTFGLAADTFPGRDQSAGKDRMVDVGFDAQYQHSWTHNDLTAMASYIYERETWHASQALEATSNASDNLRNFKITLDDLYNKTYGASVQYFMIDGANDAALYSGSESGSPKSDGVILQANYMPLNNGTGPQFWPRSNMKVSLQYTYYNHFDGARTNYDGSGRKARDNNTLYLETWIAF
jgi:hypothetical protein